VPRRLHRFLRGLNRERRMIRERDEHVELFIRRTAPARRFVDRQDSEQVTGRMPHRDEERVLGMPGIGASPRLERRNVARLVVDRGPVEVTGLHDVRATPGKALVEQALPVAEVAHLPEQLRPRGVAAVDGRDAEVVPRRPVEIDYHRLVAERFGDRPRDRRQELVQVAACAHEPRDLEESSKR